MTQPYQPQQGYAPQQQAQQFQPQYQQVVAPFQQPGAVPQFQQPQPGYGQPQQFQAPQGYAQPQQGYAPQGQPFPAQAQQAVAAEQPVIRGSLADAYNQGAKGGSYGSSVKFPAVGAEFGGYLARDLLDTDVSPETDFATKAIKRYPDGTVRMQLKLPLNTQAGPVFPDGKATLWAKTAMLSAVIRAAVAAGYDENLRLKQGDWVWVRRVSDVPTGKGNPMHDFEAQVIPAGQAPAPVAAPALPAAPAPAAPVQVPNAPDGYNLQHPEQYQFSQAQPQQAAYQMATGQPMAPAPQQFAPVPATPAVPAAPTAPAAVPGNPFVGMTLQQAVTVATITRQPLPPELRAQLDGAPDLLAQYSAAGLA